ncbi:MAG: 1-(5-phosphoribosyl)-5-[(5-phosphoribosylamino)methylideneamino]imidazole-4-carboxamide isomerase [Anaerolineae bacterium]|nr:1-(5-phosphoribosyl)-5-[(5-phosphoribosylamino)methylideneamino]imidazole-4-carboxamide isomerase [Anaerolineae bacterium]MDW8099070.1 1-(5-phosphoribosyl)-5-[(5-phosphoribosylamino)methylideneamino]imidazole-4-carboxamide isomerase [Anaerolineae bacterium]
MIIFPAIDLRQGRVVRLRQGDPHAETVYSDDPVATAQRWASLGAEWLHVVNLDGALELDDAAVNLRYLAEIHRAVPVLIQFGGGLRTLADIELALQLGATRVVLGTVAIRQPELVAHAVDRFGAERIVVGIDARDGRVAVHGWRDVTEMAAIELAREMSALGVSRIVYTDIGRDGMLSGVHVQAIVELAQASQLPVIASGGVRDLRDIEALKAFEPMGIEGVIVGQALYAGTLDLTAAIELAK